MAWIPSAGDNDQMAVEEQQEPETNMFSLFEAIRQGTTKQTGFSNEATKMEEEEDEDGENIEETNENDDDDDDDPNENGTSPGGNEAEQNTMEIKVDSKMYASGDVVTGSVNLNVVYPFLAKGVLVCLHGSEKVHYQSAPTGSSQNATTGRRSDSFSPFWDSIGSGRSMQPSQQQQATTTSSLGNNSIKSAVPSGQPTMGYGRICLPFQRVQNLNSLNDIVSSPLSGSPMSSYNGYNNSSNSNSNGSMTTVSSSSSACIVTANSTTSTTHVPSRLGETASASSYTQHTTSLPSVPYDTNSSEKTSSMPYITTQQQQQQIQIQNSNALGRRDAQRVDPQVREIRGSNDILKKIEKVHSFEGVYMPGTYTFPFRCMLPANLPASCELRGGDWERGTGYSAKTSYKVFGFIEGIIGKKLKGAEKFIVTERLPPDTKPPTVMETKEVQSKVALSMSCKLNKAEYAPGERILLGVTAKNMCKASTGRVILSLVHEVTLNTPPPQQQQQQQHSNHSRHNQSLQQLQAQNENESKKEINRIAYSEVSHYEMQPIGPYYYGVKWVGFDLPKQLFSLKDAAEAMETGGIETDQPVISLSSHSGTLFKSKHYIRVHCSIAPGVSMRFNLPFNVSLSANLTTAAITTTTSSNEVLHDIIELPRDVTYRGLWQQNEDCSQCNGCGSKLMLWLRKHHCRNCGKIYCNSCSSKKLPIPAKKYMEPVRVCDACYATIIKSGERKTEAGESGPSIGDNTQSDCMMLSDNE